MGTVIPAQTQISASWCLEITLPSDSGPWQFGSLFWQFILAVYSGSLFWQFILAVYSGSLSWQLSGWQCNCL